MVILATVHFFFGCYCAWINLSTWTVLKGNHTQYWSWYECRTRLGNIESPLHPVLHVYAILPSVVISQTLHNRPFDYCTSTCSAERSV